MGLLDLPQPFLTWCDQVMAVGLPAYLRLILWGALGSVLSMGFYRLVSPQRKLSAVKAEIRSLRNSLLGYDGDFAGLWPLMSRSICASLKQVGLALGPAMLASLPVLFLIVWLSNAYSYGLPVPGETVEIAVTPAGPDLGWKPRQVAQRTGETWRITWPSEAEEISLNDGSDNPLLALPVVAAVPVIHKKAWWNHLIGNPLGYLPSSSQVERVEIALPPRRVFGYGPDWAAGWEAVFFAAIVLFSLAIKFLFRIH
jgi:hypothetical protein